MTWLTNLCTDLRTFASGQIQQFLRQNN